MPICKGKAFWPFVKNPDTKFEPVWRITVQMSDEEAKKLKELGAKVRRNDDGIFEFKFKRNVKNRKTGADNPAPKVVDAAKEPLNVLIGNGSDVVVQYKPFEWKNSFGTGKSFDLQAVQVLNLIPYGDGVERMADGDELEAIAPSKSAASPSVDDEY